MFTNHTIIQIFQIPAMISFSGLAWRERIACVAGRILPPVDADVDELFHWDCGLVLRLEEEEVDVGRAQSSELIVNVMGLVFEMKTSVEIFEWQGIPTMHAEANKH